MQRSARVAWARSRVGVDPTAYGAHSGGKANGVVLCLKLSL